MIEVYLFLVMFTAQIVLLSILCPNRIVQSVRQHIASNPANCFPHLYFEGEESVLRGLRLFRLANKVIVVAGVIALGLLFSYMQRTDWDDGAVEAIPALYCLLQMLPLVVLSRTTVRFNKLLRNLLLKDKRRAVLQRRGLFDFVAPALVVLTLLCYPLFVVLVFFIQLNPFQGFAGAYTNIASVTAFYLLTTFCVYHALYGSKVDPLQSHATRMHAIGIKVKIFIYSCLILVISLVINLSLAWLDWQRLEPLAHNTFLVIFALFYHRTIKTTPEELAAQEPPTHQRSSKNA